MFVIAVPGTCSEVFVICTAASAAVVVSGVLLKVTVLLSGGDVSVRVFICS